MNPLDALYILLALFIFGVLIFIHEFGHFLMARMCGVKVLEFAIGMGPKLFGWRSKKSGTKYALRLFPIGGFVSMLGENGMEPVQGDSDDAEAPSAKEAVSLINEIEMTDGSEADKEDSSNKEVASAAAINDPSAYCNQSVWKRILISVAGPAMNVILGFLVMIVIVCMIGHGGMATNQIWGFNYPYIGESVENGLQKGDCIREIDLVPGKDDGEFRDLTSFAEFKKLVEDSGTHRFDLCVARKGTSEDLYLYDVTITVADLDKFEISSSEASGIFMPGDTVVAVNSFPTFIADDLFYELTMQGHAPMDLTIIRNGEKKEFHDVVIKNETAEGTVIGVVDFVLLQEKSFNALTVMKHAAVRSVSTVKTVFDSIFGLISGRFGVEAVSGPVGITQTIGEVAKNYGFVNLLSLIAIISINLGIMNLLPLPALDGGHILIYVIELIRRKPLKKEVEGMINFVGLIVLLSLAVIIAFKDIFTLL